MGSSTFLKPGHLVGVALACALSACGGARDDAALQQRSSASAPDGVVVEYSFEPDMARGAALNAQDLRAAELAAKAADNAPGSTAVVPLRAYQDGTVARKAAATQVPVYRFYNSATASHFYTVQESERAAIIANPALAHLLYEGPAFSASLEPTPGFSPVYRFLNTQSGVHFYSISESERDSIRANPALTHYNYEGIAYYAGMVGGEGLMPLYRFFVPSKGFHFYTASASERNSIQNSLDAVYTFEGIASYVVANSTLGEMLPHTGSLSSVCLATGSNAPVHCDSAAAKALSPHQDPHRSDINPMSYSLLPGFPATSCVKDNVTGLIWEGKEASGPRGDTVKVTHYRDGRAGSASAYVNAVNASRLCGFSDWRLPTVFELFTLVHYGKESVGPLYYPMLDLTWFPNSHYSDPIAADQVSSGNRVVWMTLRGPAGVGARSEVMDLDLNPDAKFGIRLVRGAAPKGQRFSFATVPYGQDAANNVAVDAWTGLEWRRCLQGQTWNGTTCTGTVIENLNFFQALSQARQISGWRLPNIRELSSLLEPARFPAPMFDPTAFPGPLDGENGGVGQLYSSSFEPGWGSRVVTFVGDQNMSAAPDSSGAAVVRLVRLRN